MDEYVVRSEVDKRLVLGMFRSHSLNERSQERPIENDDEMNYEELRASQLDISN